MCDILALERDGAMKCPYCNYYAGFFKSYHETCKDSAEKTLKQIESILNQHRTDENVSKSVKQQIKNIAASDLMYKNYLYSKITDKSVIHYSEVVIHVESQIRILESKNRCKMVETGYRYEKMPSWSEKELLLDNSGSLIFTDRAMYLYVKSGTRRYDYEKIVNYGIDKVLSRYHAYFDIKTSSPFPHRFLLTSAIKEKRGEKEKNITLLLHSLL